MNRLFTLLLIAGSFSAVAQNSTTPKVVTNATIVQTASPLVIVGSQETAMNVMLLNPDKIESVDVFKGQKAIDKFGEKGQNGAVVIQLKEDIELLRLPQLYAHFKVKKSQQQLPILLNDKQVANPDLLLADLAEIEKVEVVKKENIFTNSTDTYLNIVAKQHPNSN